MPLNNNNPIYQLVKYLDRDVTNVTEACTLKTRSDFALWCVRHNKDKSSEQMVCKLAIAVHDWWNCGPISIQL